MKRIILFMCIVSNLYAQQYDLEFFINSYLTKSTDVRIQENTIKKEELKEKELKLGKYSKLSLSLDEYFDDKNYSGTESHMLDYSLSYGIFSHSLSYDHKENEVTSNNLTLRKELNEFINNEYKHSYDTTKIQNQISEKQRNNEKLSKISGIIEKYITVKKLEKELQLKEHSYELLLNEKKQLDIKYENGEVKRIDLELLNLDLLTNENSRENLKKQIINNREKLFSDVGVENNSQTELLSIEQIQEVKFENINRIEEEIALLENKLSEKELKFVETDDLPKLSAYTTYNIKEKGYRIGLNLTKDFELLSYNKKAAELDKENSNLSLEKVKSDKEDAIKKSKMEYEILLNEQKRLTEQKNYKERELKIYNEIYKANHISYIEFAKKRQETEEVQLEYINNNWDIISFVLNINAVDFLTKVN